MPLINSLFPANDSQLNGHKNMKDTIKNIGLYAIQSLFMTQTYISTTTEKPRIFVIGFSSWTSPMSDFILKSSIESTKFSSAYAVTQVSTAKSKK